MFFTIFVHFFSIDGLIFFGNFLNSKLNSYGYIFIKVSGDKFSLSIKLCLNESSPEKLFDSKIGKLFTLSFSIKKYSLLFNSLFEGLLLDILNLK